MDNQLEITFAELKQSSRVSLVLVIVGALMLLGSVWYSVTRLRPLQLEVNSAPHFYVSRYAKPTHIF
jgi:hypothetical protein